MLDYFDDSLTQDLECFISDIRTGVRKNIHHVLHFFPKITKREQKLAISNDFYYWNTFTENYGELNFMGSNPMKLEFKLMHLLGQVTDEEYLEMIQQAGDLINSPDAPENMLKISKSNERYLMASSNRVTTYFNLKRFSDDEVKDDEDKEKTNFKIRYELFKKLLNKLILK